MGHGVTAFPWSTYSASFFITQMSEAPNII